MKSPLDENKELVLQILQETGGNNVETARVLTNKYDIQTTETSIRRAKYRWSLRNSQRVIIPPQVDDTFELPEILNKKIITPQQKRELWEAIRDVQQAKLDTSIMQDEAYVRLNFNKPIAIAFLSDLHIGAEGTDYDYILDAVDSILETEGCYVVITGDMIDNFVWGKGTQFGELMTPRLQKIMATSLVEEIFNILIALITGCHELFSQKSDDFDFMEYLATHSRGAYLGTGGDIYLDVSGAQYHIHARHKYIGESKLNIENVFRRMWDGICHYDVGVVGHMHGQPFIMHASRHEGKHRKEVIYIRPGTAKIYDLHTRSKYGSFGHAFAVPIVIFMPEHKTMIPFRNLKSGLEVLKLLREGWNDEC